MLDDRGEIQAHVLGVHGRLTAAKGSRRSLLRIVRCWYGLCYGFSNWFWSLLNNRGFSHGSLLNNRDLFSHWCCFGNWCHFGNNFDWLLKDGVQDLASLRLKIVTPDLLRGPYDDGNHASA